MGWVRRFAFLLLVSSSNHTIMAAETQSPRKPAREARHNIVLITVDTLRADRLGPYGNRQVETPWVAKLARDGVLFTDAIAQVPLTLPSHCSIMTGNDPGSTGVRDQAGFALADGQTTLAENLKQAGYDTAAFVASSVLEASTGLAQGFDVYSDPSRTDGKTVAGPEGLERRGSVIIAEALKWIAAPGRKKFFVWIHLYEPHAPYQPPQPYASRYQTDLYNGEVAYVDSLLGKFFQSAMSRGWYDTATIVFTSDHGESLGEHGEETHGFFLYDATLHVPLIVKLPRSRWKGARVADQVRSIDIMPTILEAAGVDPGSKIEGESLLPRMSRKSEPAKLVAYSETYFPYYHFRWSPLRSLRTHKYKYIEAPRPELYDLETDPGEKRNIASSRPAVCASFASQLAMDHPVLAAEPSSAQGVDSETYRKLQSLGYVGTPRASKVVPSTSLADPKDKLAVYLLLQDAIKDATEGRADQSIQRLQQVVEQDDQIIDAHLNLGVNYVEMGRFVEAIGAFKKVLSLDDRNVLATFNLALCYANLGRMDDAISGFLRTLELSPHEVDALMALGRAYQLRGAFADAEDAFVKALAQKPNLAEAHGYLAEVYRARGMADKAEVEDREARRLSHKK